MSNDKKQYPPETEHSLRKRIIRFVTTTHGIAAAAGYINIRERTVIRLRKQDEGRMIEELQMGWWGDFLRSGAEHYAETRRPIRDIFRSSMTGGHTILGMRVEWDSPNFEVEVV
jgi:hypothetical protein